MTETEMKLRIAELEAQLESDRAEYNRKCVWTDIGGGDWKAECGDVWSWQQPYQFCPGCGRWIEVTP